MLENALGKEMVLPERKINKQKKNYSGKKKMHTRKNLIISDEKRRICYLSPTVEGKKHDYGSE